MLGSKLRTVCLAATLALAGCSGAQVLDLSTDLVRLQEQKRQIGDRPKDGEALAKLAHIEGEFERLAEAAYASIGRAPDVKSKIFYYRIASTADWQRGNPRAIQVAREGTAFCNANDGMGVSPRDCAVLAILPNLAVNDIWMTRFATVENDMRAPGAAGRYREAVDHLVAAYVDLGAAIDRFGRAAVAPELIAVMGDQRRQLGTNIRRLVDALIDKAPTAEDRAEMRQVCAGLRSSAPEIRTVRCPLL